VWLERGDAARADGMLHQGLGTQQVRADAVVATALQVAQARVLLLRGQPADAVRVLDRLPTGTRLGARSVESIRVARAEALLALGDTAAAAALLEPGRRGSSGASRAPGPAALVVQARCLLAAGDPAAVERVVAPLRAASAPATASAAGWLITALAADRRREDGRAASALAAALERAAPEGIRLPFLLLDRSRTTALLRRQVRARGARHGYASDLLHATAPEAAAPAVPAPVDPLTDREITVLQLLPTMLSNAEIADELFVSVNTVKAHLKGLYRKLGVTSRRAAVERGRGLGLLL
jgi:LuxR family maltose regulon positive regulatory protein